MNTENNDRLSSFRALLERFYEGTASPAETDRLYALAKELADIGREQIPPDLWNDIALLTAISDFSSESNTALEAATPPELEKRLENHIHALAISERRASISGWRKIGRGCAAAAAVALLFFAGYRLLPDRVGPDLSPLNTTGHIASAVSTQSSDNPVSGQATPQFSILPDKGSSTQETIPSPDKKNRNANKRTVSKGGDIHDVKDSETDGEEYIYPEDENIDSADDFQDFSFEPDSRLVASIEEAESSEKEDIVPIPNTVSMSTLDPSQSLTMPMTTLSASLDNVFQSVNLLSESLSMALTPSDSEREKSAAIPTQPI